MKKNKTDIEIDEALIQREKEMQITKNNIEALQQKLNEQMGIELELGGAINQLKALRK